MPVVSSRSTMRFALPVPRFGQGREFAVIHFLHAMPSRP